MISDLIAMTFGGEAAALRAKQALEQMRYSPFLGIVSALVVTRDAAGKVVVHEQWELPAHLPSTSQRMARLLVDVCFGKPGDDGGQELVRAGLDEAFVGSVVSALEPRSSMILGYFPRGSLVDVQQVLEALSQFRGTLYHTTVPAEVEEAILKSWGDEQPDVVLTDLRMPVMDGLEATRQIKDRWPQVKVVVLSLYESHRDEALAAGSDRFLLKDGTCSSLTEFIRSLTVSPRTDEGGAKDLKY